MNNKRRTWIIIAIFEILAFSVAGFISLYPFDNLFKDSSNFFISEWDTTQTSIDSSNFNQIRLPLQPNGIYNFTVYWGDNSKDNIITWDQPEVLHTYHKSGNYSISISGTISGWSFNNTGDKLKLREIKQWGNLRLGNSGGYFSGCYYLEITATDVLNLTGTTSLSHMFRYCIKIRQIPNINSWDVSNVRDMDSMFENAVHFNQNLDSWDVSNVRDMDFMFSYASNFDQNLSSWNVSKVSRMERIFFLANLSTPNYDSLLIGWSKLILQDGVIFNAAFSKYSPGAATVARNYIEKIYHWQISDGGQE